MKNKIRILSEKVKSLKETITTEESTKTAFILPLLQILGYDIFNPLELIPECHSDIGSKKGEKVDYCVCLNQSPTIIIECKNWSEDLNCHVNQLIRYYHTSKAKFGLLTNGIKYCFFTDLDNLNVMDSDPFFTFNLLSFSEEELDALIEFSKSKFNEENILTIAEKLKYLSKFKNVILKELSSPSEEFNKLLIKQVFSGRLVQKQKEKFSEIINTALEELFDFKKLIPESLVTTTKEELDFYKNIVDKLPQYKQYISYKDFKGHFSIILHNSTRKCIVKALFNNDKKYIILFDGESEKKIEYNVDALNEYMTYINARIDKLINL